jgi:hypothetical protein
MSGASSELSDKMPVSRMTPCQGQNVMDVHIRLSIACTLSESFLRWAAKESYGWMPDLASGTILLNRAGI